MLFSIAAHERPKMERDEHSAPEWQFHRSMMPHPHISHCVTHHSRNAHLLGGLLDNGEMYALPKRIHFLMWSLYVCCVALYYDVEMSMMMAIILRLLIGHCAHQKAVSEQTRKKNAIIDVSVARDRFSVFEINQMRVRPINKRNVLRIFLWEYAS